MDTRLDIAPIGMRVAATPVGSAVAVGGWKLFVVLCCKVENNVSVLDTSNKGTREK